MVEATIHGEGRTAKDNMDLGQVRRVFDPDWIQTFDSGRVTIQFIEENEERGEALKSFMEMRGYELYAEGESGDWKDYKFNL